LVRLRGLLLLAFGRTIVLVVNLPFLGKNERMADLHEVPLLPEQVVAERSHVVIPSLPNWIEPTVEFLRRKAVLGGVCEETPSGKLLIALHEAISNAVIHGNLELSSDLKEQGDNAFAEALARRASDPHLASRKVDIVVDFDGEVYRWVITDQGKIFNESITIGLDRRCEPVVCYARDLSKGGISFIAQEVPPPEITISFAPSVNWPTLRSVAN